MAQIKPWHVYFNLFGVFVKQLFKTLNIMQFSDTKNTLKHTSKHTGSGVCLGVFVFLIDIHYEINYVKITFWRKNFDKNITKHFSNVAKTFQHVAIYVIRNIFRYLLYHQYHQAKNLITHD